MQVIIAEAMIHVGSLLVCVCVKLDAFRDGAGAAKRPADLRKADLNLGTIIVIKALIRPRASQNRWDISSSLSTGKYCR